MPESHSARSAWIETAPGRSFGQYGVSHSARSAWIETLAVNKLNEFWVSHSARSAWIETMGKYGLRPSDLVALRKECVD